MSDKGCCSGKDDGGVNRFLILLGLLLAGFFIAWGVLLEKVFNGFF